MERKIGEIFQYNNEWYQCLKSASCDECAFLNSNCIDTPNIKCSADDRKDHYSVIFKRLEKVGEPFPCRNMSSGRYSTIAQWYKVFVEPILTDDSTLSWYNSINETILIALNNKEDMEEKKPTYEELLHYYHSTVGLWAIDRSPQEVSLDWIRDNAFQLGIDEKHSNSENIGKNLKPFDLQAAKSGKPVCTRDGRKARIICFDMNANSPIVALVDYNGQEVVVCCHNDGRNYHAETTYNDLMMLSERKEGWVNVYKETSGEYYVGKIIHKTEKFAFDVACPDNYIGTVKIEWYE